MFFLPINYSIHEQILDMSSSSDDNITTNRLRLIKSISQQNSVSLVTISNIITIYFDYDKIYQTLEQSGQCIRRTDYYGRISFRAEESHMTPPKLIEKCFDCIIDRSAYGYAFMSSSKDKIIQAKFLL